MAKAGRNSADCPWEPGGSDKWRDRLWQNHTGEWGYDIKSHTGCKSVSLSRQQGTLLCYIVCRCLSSFLMMPSWVGVAQGVMWSVLNPGGYLLYQVHTLNILAFNCCIVHLNKRWLLLITFCLCLIQNIGYSRTACGTGTRRETWTVCRVSDPSGEWATSHPGVNPLLHHWNTAPKTHRRSVCTSCVVCVWREGG